MVRNETISFSSSMTGRGDNVRSYLNTSFLTMKVPAMDDSRPSSADSFRMDTSSIVTSDGSTSFDEVRIYNGLR